MGDSKKEEQLFDHVLVIKLELKDGKPAPKVGYRFPPDPNGEGTDESSTIAQFCFPEQSIPKPSRKKKSETFSFVLTATDGTKRFGYSRRFLDLDVPECVCIISLVPSFSLFSRLLDIVEERRKASASAVYNFLKTVLAHPFPDPGVTFTVKAFSPSGAGMDEYKLTRPASETCGDYVSLDTLFKVLNVSQVVELWESLLLERRFLLVADDLGSLSSTISALCALISPFTWQHVLVPILPNALIGYVTAPMPFLIGCLKSSLTTIKNMGMPLEEIVMVDLDAGKYIQVPSDFQSLLPPDSGALLRNTLSAISAQGGTGEKNDLYSKAFMRFFQTILVGYENFFSSDQSLCTNKYLKKKLYFDHKAFIKSHAPEDIPFLEKFHSSQLWFMFMNEREDMAARNEPVVFRKDLDEKSLPAKTFGMITATEGQTECAGCGSSFVQTDLISSFKDRIWHTKCFACAFCNSNMEGDIVRDYSGDICCSRCSEEDKKTSLWTTMKSLFSRSAGPEDQDESGQAEGYEEDPDEGSQLRAVPGKLFSKMKGLLHRKDSNATEEIEAAASPQPIPSPVPEEPVQHKQLQPPKKTPPPPPPPPPQPVTSSNVPITRSGSGALLINSRENPSGRTGTLVSSYDGATKRRELPKAPSLSSVGSAPQPQAMPASKLTVPSITAAQSGGKAESFGGATKAPQPPSALPRSVVNRLDDRPRALSDPAQDVVVCSDVTSQKEMIMKEIRMLRAGSLSSRPPPKSFGAGASSTTSAPMMQRRPTLPSSRPQVPQHSNSPPAAGSGNPYGGSGNGGFHQTVPGAPVSIAPKRSVVIPPAFK